MRISRNTADAMLRLWAERQKGLDPHAGDGRYKPCDDPPHACFAILQVEAALAGRPDLRAAANVCYLQGDQIPRSTAYHRRWRLLARIVAMVRTAPVGLPDFDATIVEAALREIGARRRCKAKRAL